MSQNFEEQLDELNEDLQDEVLDETEQTGEVSEDSVEDSPRSGRGRQAAEVAKKLTVFDAMLLISLVCITAATFLMFLELRNFGSFPGFVWRTDEAVVEVGR